MSIKLWTADSNNDHTQPTPKNSSTKTSINRVDDYSIRRDTFTSSTIGISTPREVVGSPGR